MSDAACEVLEEASDSLESGFSGPVAPRKTLWQEMSEPSGKFFRGSIFFLTTVLHAGLLVLWLAGLSPKVAVQPLVDQWIDITEAQESPPLSPAIPPQVKPLEEVIPIPESEPLPAPVVVDSPVSAPTEASGAAQAAEASPQTVEPQEVPFLSQGQIDQIPVIPTKEVLAQIRYPELAAKMGLEATVFLELFIDKTGKVVRISVLKDPGSGFAQAAVAALDGLQCEPAKIAGQAVPVRFRYPVRFTLK